MGIAQTAEFASDRVRDAHRAGKPATWCKLDVEHVILRQRSVTVAEKTAADVVFESSVARGS
jgi:hypothetical protein